MRIKAKIKNLIPDKKGFSLTELLVALILCLMTFALVCTALNAAARQLKTQTLISESKMLCGTLSLAVEDELRYAREIEFDGDDKIIYKNSQRVGESDNVTMEVNNNYLVLKYSAGSTSGSSSGEGDDSTAPLVPEINYKDGSKKASVSFKQNSDRVVGTITIETTIANGSTIETKQEFAVKPINDNAFK